MVSIFNVGTVSQRDKKCCFGTRTHLKAHFKFEDQICKHALVIHTLEIYKVTFSLKKKKNKNILKPFENSFWLTLNPRWSLSVFSAK